MNTFFSSNCCKDCIVEVEETNKEETEAIKYEAWLCFKGKDEEICQREYIQLLATLDNDLTKQDSMESIV